MLEKYQEKAIIELSRVRFGLKLCVISKLNERAARVRLENHKYDFRQKMHDTKFNYHFITSISKSHSFFFANTKFYYYF